MEKGGKGFSMPASGNGKDDSSGKSKKGKRVQFNSEGLSSDRDDFLSDLNGIAKGSSMDKGGKGDKSSKSGKASSTKEPQLDQELPENVECLMDCEAAQILGGIQEQMVLLSRDSSIKLPVSFDKALQHAKSSARYANPQSVRKILNNLKMYGVSDGEVAAIANIYPESVDEVFALVPTLKSKSFLAEPLKDAVDQLAELKQQS